MKRRTFLQKTAIVSSISVLSSPVNLFANNSSHCRLDLSSILSQGKKLVLNGLAYDAISNELINASIMVKSGYGLFTKTRLAKIENGAYSIIGNIFKQGGQKIKVKIESEGYKTFDGNIYFSSLGCQIHTDMWQYNPNFKPEFIPKNEITPDQINSNFNFYLVKK